MGSHADQSEVKQPWIETPLVESSVLSKVAGCRIFLKLENLQPGYSFKSRGIGNLVRHHFLAARKSPNFNPDDLHFFSSSGGNAGIACVTAAHSFGVKSTVVVPTFTAQSMIVKIQAAGATKVISYGDMWAKADQYLRETVIPAAEENGAKAIYVPPFNDPLVWDGASTLVDELKTQMTNSSPPDAIICSVGGGGLFCGIMLGLARHDWSTTKVFAVETHGADSLAQSVQAGKLITLPAITSIAKSLGASQVASRAFELSQSPNVQTVVLTDAEAAEGSWRFADDERMLVEAACGVSVALAYRGRLKKLLQHDGFGPDTKVVIVVCGGSHISNADLVRWKEEFAGQLGAELEGEELVSAEQYVISIGPAFR